MSNLALGDKVKIHAVGEHFGKIGTVVFVEEKHGFKKYPYSHVTLLVGEAELTFSDFSLDAENIEKLEKEKTTKKNKRKLNEDKEEHCINYATDVRLHRPEGQTLTGENIMNEQAAEYVATSVQPVVSEHRATRAGRPKNPSSAIARAKSVYVKMAGSKRADIIAAFVQELGIKEGSASVYYYNIKKELAAA
jgi:hypothetical protein